MEFILADGTESQSSLNTQRVSLLYLVLLAVCDKKCAIFFSIEWLGVTHRALLLIKMPFKSHFTLSLFLCVCVKARTTINVY